MAAAAPHRGTDVTVVEVGAAALSLADRPAADLVIGVRDGLALALTGSWDNADEVARELSSDAGDRVSLLADAYRRWGDDVPARMRGVFAAVITDGRRVVAFRDHVGYRPIFYRSERDAFFVASEAKQVLAGSGIGREPDVDVVEAILFRAVEDDTPSALRGVMRLPKASVLTVEPPAEPVIRRYWHPERLLESARMDDEELQERFEVLFDQAVSRCLSGSDAVALSGGIDSPAVAAYAAPRHAERFGRPLQAISVTFPDHPSVDERRFVEPLAAELNIPLHLFEQHANPIADMRRWVKVTDTPYPGAALAQYEEDYLRARSLGIGTVLTGEHAEYVFALQWYTLDHFLTHRRWGPALRQLRERRRGGASMVALARLIARSVASDRFMELRNSLDRGRRRPTIPAWVDHGRVAPGPGRAASARWRGSQLTGFIGPGISLEAEEVCQAVCGVTSRKPWTDVDLWELFLSLPAEQKFPDLRPKGLVRRLLRGRVPDFILDRKDKTVFDEAAMATVDYDAVRDLIFGGGGRLGGIDYDALRTLIDRRSMTPLDYMWARNLANAHAFLASWDEDPDRP